VNFTTEQIFSINNEATFNEVALAIFRHQSINCEVYNAYIQNLKIDLASIENYRQIPFLPIGFFKTHPILSTTDKPEVVFSSSGTTGQVTSKHLVSDVKVYEESYNKAFEIFYGKPKDLCILALLPSYLEREGSSLIYMVDDLLKQSEQPQSGYFLHDLEKLYSTLLSLKVAKQKTILIGVTYALLDFVEQFQIDFPELTVMETGGMKGKRKEMVREELHETLYAGFGVDNIHSEYGMTELLSQGYSYGQGIFNCPTWMKILLRDTSDPLSLVRGKQSGGINVIDLANFNSCSFIATQDLGKVYEDGSFEVLGRFDNADIRGCNLLVQ
jgi:phenylacetate-coenzyme A ligase PaaK-like adenylate-forming protein